MKISGKKINSIYGTRGKRYAYGIFPSKLFFFREKFEIWDSEMSIQSVLSIRMTSFYPAPKVVLLYLHSSHLKAKRNGEAYLFFIATAIFLESEEYEACLRKSCGSGENWRRRKIDC